MAVRDAAAYASQTRTRGKSTFGAEKSPKRVLSFALLGPISSLSLGSFWCMNVSHVASARSEKRGAWLAYSCCNNITGKRRRRRRRTKSKKSVLLSEHGA